LEEQPTKAKREERNMIPAIFFIFNSLLINYLGNIIGLIYKV